MLHAHLMNIGRPETFNIELNKILKENGFQEMKFPDNPPSGDILQITKMMLKTPPSHETSSERMEEEDIASHPGKKKEREMIREKKKNEAQRVKPPTLPRAHRGGRVERKREERTK